MYCNNCGTQNQDESVFCSKCGNRLNPIQGMTPPPQVMMAPVRKSNGMAIAAMILGIVSFLFTICAIPAIILGAVSLNQIKKDPTMEGKGMALAGIIIGSIMLVLWILFIILIVVLAATNNTTTYDSWVIALSMLR